MPAIRGTYYNHPETGEPGIWIWLIYGGVIGLSDTQMKAIKLSGTEANKRIQLRVALMANLQPKAEIRTNLASLDAETADWLKINPEPYCRYEATSNEYVSQPVIIDFEVYSTNPLRVCPIVSEGASRAVFKYANKEA